MKTVAIIPAAGSGRRMEGALSKQYLALAGVPILVHTLRKFEGAPAVDTVFLVVPAGDEDVIRRDMVDSYGLRKVRKILPGGRERQDSVRAGIDALPEDTEIVVIHDAVRPFVTGELIAASVEGARAFGAVSLGVPVKDTVKSVETGGWVDHTMERAKLWLTQTPQTFRVEVIREAYRRAFADGFYGTDDASLAERIGIRVRMLPGIYENIKITTPGDIELGAILIRNRGGA
ncbi:MAG TPA: 2-C-methyl-D-erythritol 4-phosphate cytidylyltransferase [Syntrophales bacterium]|nr:2-C-methyl-D-erythritol 4-phosphate cytidylyltransferase [Syntrophales bacterium]HOX95597.1 2-C-methyl-D-erythritol 4-phosphate cytidylyltransferase [Syntrophales bacterium]HPI57198.1 2-C-methyl-D-erythritol 4-phosphate cytidylyltransferase [Syntrophales bacterium]HPN23418.1 2-C-methyl-D-erythritol 4-phosphate cytidylyltransferase [Syntrophales bacterium]HQM28057.1 2-C-methyl-D-erythritol 4-phosphate cytidylyltransferase [Syntrophales bacterium]